MDALKNLKKLLKWQGEGKSTALATVIWKQGSALRGVGAKMAISSDMEMAGSVSGGCVEGAVVQEALKVMESGIPVILEYGIADETAWSVGLACGGTIKVLVQKVFAGDFGNLNLKIINLTVQLMESGKLFFSLTLTNGEQKGDKCIIAEGKCVYPDKKPDWLSEKLVKEAKTLEVTESSQVVKIEENEVFIDIYAPRPRLIVIGAVHIAMPLTQMAQITGFSSVVIDPRKAFNTAERFPDVNQRLLVWPAEGLEKIGLESGDYLLLLTHDDKLDLPALEMGIDRQVKYIGMLSSRQAREKRFKKMEDVGYKRDQLDRVHSPVGLDIGARSQEEIALSILAEITAVRYGKA